MDAEIRAVDTERRKSEGQRLSVKLGQVKATVKSEEGLPFGGASHHKYVEVRAESDEGSTHSVLIARLNADDLKRIFDEARSNRLID